MQDVQHRRLIINEMLDDMHYTLSRATERGLHLTTEDARAIVATARIEAGKNPAWKSQKANPKYKVGSK